MSIFNKDLQLFKQDFSCKDGNKEKYGEVNTDFRLVKKIIGLLPDSIFGDPDLKWLDPCAGKGYFTMILYERLFKSLQPIIKNDKKRHDHIISKMIFMVELNPDHIPILYETFGMNANIANVDFLEMKNMHFDIIIGKMNYDSNQMIFMIGLQKSWNSQNVTMFIVRFLV